MELRTKLEELILLSIWKLGEEAYGNAIYNHIQSVTGKKLSLGGVYFPLERLVKKGCLRAYSASASLERRGRISRCYKLTQTGFDILNDIHRINEIMWAGFPAGAQPQGGRP